MQHALIKEISIPRLIYELTDYTFVVGEFLYELIRTKCIVLMCLQYGIAVARRKHMCCHLFYRKFENKNEQIN